MVTVVEPPPEPPVTIADPAELAARYLDYYRDAAVRKLDGLGDDELQGSRLPSGWTPLGLLKHLAYVERYWFRAVFAGEQVELPWLDEESDGSLDRDIDADWRVEPGESVDDVRTLYANECAQAREIVSGASLGDVAQGGDPRYPPGGRPTLAWILLHVLQEYARHVGHLDVVRELVDGVVGE